MKKLLIILVLIVSSVSASWMTENDPDVNHWDHIKTAALCYSGTDLTALGYVARHYDVIVLYNNSAWMDTVKAHNDSIKALRYLTLSSIRAEDWDTIPGWAIDRSLTNEDSVYLWVESDSTVITGAGGTCDDGPTITVSINGDTVSFCGWAENRVMADFRKSITQDYFRWKPFWRMDLNADGDADDWKDYQGVFEDEAHWYHGKHHMMFPLRHTTDDSTNWINTTTWQDVNG
ncbi:hypothetical protein KAR91_14580, partial [Candidatus Pacearchaeota archaeon]|nr:hypothetical protein [Candidatus Pacearchaeota archaeon]